MRVPNSLYKLVCWVLLCTMGAITPRRSQPPGDVFVRARFVRRAAPPVLTSYSCGACSHRTTPKTILATNTVFCLPNSRLSCFSIDIRGAIREIKTVN